MNNINRLLSGLSFVIALGFAGSAFAISLDAAKAQGLVGETQSGYLASVKSADSETSALITQINQQRKAKYVEIAQKNGTDVSAVEKLAAKRAIEETSRGNYIQDGSGNWARK